MSTLSLPSEPIRLCLPDGAESAHIEGYVCVLENGRDQTDISCQHIHGDFREAVGCYLRWLARGIPDHCLLSICFGVVMQHRNHDRAWLHWLSSLPGTRRCSEYMELLQLRLENAGRVQPDVDPGEALLLAELRRDLRQRPAREPGAKAWDEDCATRTCTLADVWPPMPVAIARKPVRKPRRASKAA